MMSLQSFNPRMFSFMMIALPEMLTSYFIGERIRSTVGLCQYIVVVLSKLARNFSFTLNTAVFHRPTTTPRFSPPSEEQLLLMPRHTARRV